jgi:hypothetical protein
MFTVDDFSEMNRLRAIAEEFNLTLKIVQSAVPPLPDEALLETNTTHELLRVEIPTITDTVSHRVTIPYDRFRELIHAELARQSSKRIRRTIQIPATELEAIHKTLTELAECVGNLLTEKKQ